jgi:hypothetical protein
MPVQTTSGGTHPDKYAFKYESLDASNSGDEIAAECLRFKTGLQKS